MARQDMTPQDKERRLTSLTRKCRIILSESQALGEQLMEESFFQREIYDLISRCLLALEVIDASPPGDFGRMRDFHSIHYFHILNMTDQLFAKMIPSREKGVFTEDKWSNQDKATLFFANSVMMHQNYRALRELIAGYFVDQYKSMYELVCDHESPLFNSHGLKTLLLPSVMERIRPAAAAIIEGLGLSARVGDSEAQVLEGQISEIIKNAVVHGNKKDPQKSVNVWFGADDHSFRIIVEDQGAGFHRLEEWNEFNRKRNEALQKGDMEEIVKYVQYKGPESTEHDGGNALFAAVEFWDSSLVYNLRRNKVAALKYIRTMQSG